MSKAVEDHHLASNNGAWRRHFEELFAGAGMRLSHVKNIVRLENHYVSHGFYNYEVYTRLAKRVKGLRRGSAAYRKAIESELTKISREVQDPYSSLGALLRNRASWFESHNTKPSDFGL
ncbi:MAG: AHH domain-containing protein [Zavarzinella sp.]